MKHISFAAVILGGALCTTSLPADSATPPNLDGRYLVARLYRDWRTKPDRHRTPCLPLEKAEDLHEKFLLEIKNKSVTLDFNGCDDNCVVVITGPDQTDPEVKKAWSNVVYAKAAKTSSAYSFAEHTYCCRQRRGWTFRDAFGQAIPNARVRVFLSAYRNPTKALITDELLDREGRTNMPYWKTEVPGGCVVVSHPDYGIAILDRLLEDPILPLARATPEARAQSIWGVVVDDANNPIAGAKIGCGTAHTPGGGKINWGNWSGVVLTDRNGKFALCMSMLPPVRGPATIPPNSSLQVCVKPRRDSMVPSQCLAVPCGRPTTIWLEAPEKFFRKFAFEDANGSALAHDRLDRLLICVNTSEKGQLQLRYEDLKDGVAVPLGRYKGWVEEPRDKTTLYFEPIDVTADSSEKLVFRPLLRRQTLYCGQAVYAFTDRPAEGALVAVVRSGDSQEHTAAMITDQQWEQLHALGRNPPPDEPALEPVRRIWPHFKEVLRADATGRFEVTLARTGYEGSDFIICVVEQGRMPVYHKLYWFDKDANEVIILPPSRLLPAARVAFNLEYGSQENFRAHMTWDLDPQYGQYFDDFVKYKSIKGVWFPLHKGIQCGRQPFLVSIPAWISLRLSFQMHTDRVHTPVFTKSIKAEPGDYLDLGHIEMRETIPVYVQVVDPNGDPVQAVAVKHSKIADDHYFGQTVITDQDGMAEFNVPLHFKANFLISLRDEGGQYLTEDIAYETNGPQDANNIYTLRLSDEMLNALFK